MRTITLLLAFLTTLTLVACGGGGGGGASSTGGGTQSIVGRVVDIGTTGPVTPAPTIRIGGLSETANSSDGSFSIDAAFGSTSAIVDASGAGYGTWSFPVPNTTDAIDLGDLYVGPQRVTVRGTVRNAITNDPIANALLTFAGRSALTNSSGQFSMPEVAYSNTSQTGFWGVFGRAEATGFFASEFSANGQTASSGVVTVDDVLLVPATDDPPGFPYNIYGQVLPSATGGGLTVELRQGGSAVRTVTSSPNGTFYFWVPAGTYTIRAIKSGSFAESNVSLTSQNQVVRRDVSF
jgi:hypothetical protein